MDRFCDWTLLRDVSDVSLGNGKHILVLCSPAKI